MKLTELALPGVYRLELEPHEDERGLFARTFDAGQFAAHGLATDYPQTSLSVTLHRGTMRGLHWQAEPHAEAKIVRCVRGRVHDVAVDVRPDSPAFRSHVGVELDADLRNALYLPTGIAHGFLTLTDDCEVHYAMSAEYAPESSRGARWDDPAFAIAWPAAVEVISERDRAWPPFAG